MKPWAEKFYASDDWHATRDAYMESAGHLCERCSTPDDPVIAKIVHHRTYLTPKNIIDPNISLSWENLEALCQTCHTREHLANKSRFWFDDSGIPHPI